MNKHDENVSLNVSRTGGHTWLEPPKPRGRDTLQWWKTGLTQSPNSSVHHPWIHRRIKSCFWQVEYVFVCRICVCIIFPTIVHLSSAFVCFLSVRKAQLSSRHKLSASHRISSCLFKQMNYKVKFHEEAVRNQRVSLMTGSMGPWHLATKCRCAIILRKRDGDD